MGLLHKLASALNRRDEAPNIELAKQVSAKKDALAVKELVENLSNKDKNIQSDCIKILDEIAKLEPGLVAPFADDLIGLLNSKNNRLQWGAMAAIDSITSEAPKTIYKALGHIISSADKGTVITNDHCVGILVKLCANKKYYKDAWVLLMERIKISPTNQLPMYAEQAATVIKDTDRKTFVKLLICRIDEIEKETKRNRVQKVIRKLSA